MRSEFVIFVKAAVESKVYEGGTVSVFLLCSVVRSRGVWCTVVVFARIRAVTSQYSSINPGTAKLSFFLPFFLSADHRWEAQP